MSDQVERYTPNAPFTIKMGIWLLMLTIILLFGAFTYAFVGSRAEVSTSLSLPVAFYISTLVLIGSSICLHWALQQKSIKEQKQGLMYALVLGTLFIVVQGWGAFQLFSQQTAFITELTEEIQRPILLPFQYIYLLSGMHALHLLGGMGFLLYVYQKWPASKEKYFEVSTYFWHFFRHFVAISFSHCNPQVRNLADIVIYPTDLTFGVG